MFAIENTEKVKIMLNEQQSAIIQTLAYFEIFNYPLTIDEIWAFSSINCTKTTVLKELNWLISSNLLYKLSNYYSLTNKIENIETRNKGNSLAEKTLQKAVKRGKLIQKFPFVRSVYLSGTISKNYMDDESDIDFFIITEKEKMWLARTFLVLYKKLFLLNSSKHFCLNYFIDYQSIEIKSQNIFTATEFATLIPVTNNKVFTQFKHQNQWVYGYYPNQQQLLKNKNAFNTSTPLFKLIIEKLLSNQIGNYLNKYFMSITQTHWNKKFKHLPKKDFEIGLKSTENESKHHPKNYQHRVEEQLAQIKHDFEIQNNVTLQ